MRTVMTQLKRIGVSAAEVDFQDTWQRATVGVAVVAPQYSQLQRLVRSVEVSLRALDEIELLEVHVSHLERPE